MSQQNQVIRRGNVVVKTFASHLNYLKEISIYEKLEGSDLAPRVLYTGSDTIEHAYIGGDTLEDVLEKNSGDISALAGYFRMFFDWYVQFRAKTGNCIENISFSKFILSDGKLYYVDFEHCRADYAEKDVASLAAQVCLFDEPFSFKSIELCRLFLCIGAGITGWDPERLHAALSEKLARSCEEKGIKYQSKPAEYLLQAAITCGIIIADDPSADIGSAMKFLSTAPQRIISCREKGKPQCPSFECVETGLSPADSVYAVSNILKLVKQPWCLILSTGKRYERETIMKLLSAEKEDFNAIIPEENEDNENPFPMLVKTDTLSAAAANALASGISGLMQAMQHLRIKGV